MLNVFDHKEQKIPFETVASALFFYDWGAILSTELLHHISLSRFLSLIA